MSHLPHRSRFQHASTQILSLPIGLPAGARTHVRAKACLPVALLAGGLLREAHELTSRPKNRDWTTRE